MQTRRVTMERIKNKRIYVGRESSTGQLLIAVEGCPKPVALGAPHSVPGSVSRCQYQNGMAHAEVLIDSQGSITVKNMKSQNVTYVNGSEINAKRVDPACVIELGKDRYPVRMDIILSAAEKALGNSYSAHIAGSNNSGFQADSPNKNKEVAKRYNISHLEQVWEWYKNEQKSIRDRNKRINLIRSGCGIFTMFAAPCIYLFGPIGYTLTGIGIISSLYSLIGLNKENPAEMIEQLNEQFQDRYMCPNPKCGKFLGNISYRLLKRQYSMHCPYCKCEFVEK